ncbi:glycosyltransferase [Allonocardiopsis opalescens]|uniref:Glycosyltransferase involved in cell wall biosynthesis n=1 Tax=Allonocardiopsis opalescens TaxID=1144618 RepID=A0A2T0PXP4_9ACTN|nr:glycosyltransferase [Allonocardiopsis opalescens]PRX96303.1 glycosyltransferase involved in cell wall biosynthesis [Allonocardiopsis opalescens]
MTDTDPARRLRIVVGADTYPPDVNGAARYSQRLASGLAERGHEVHMICPVAPPEHADRMPDGKDAVRVHRVRSHRTPVHPTFRVSLPWQATADVRALLTEIRPDVVHVQSHFVVGRALAKVSADRRLPLVATNHFMPDNLVGYVNLPGWVSRPLMRWGWRDLIRVFDRAHLVTAPTASATALLHEHGLGQRAVPVSNGIDIDRFRLAEPAFEPEGPTILFVGRLDAEKYVEELIEALSLLPAELGARLEIVGDGVVRDRLTALAERLGLADRVVFRGVVTDDELAEAYARASVFGMPGRAELQSLATMEAMAAGLPVVAADAVALPHLVRPGRNGWLYEPGDVPELARRLTQVLSDPELAARMSAAGQEIISSHGTGAMLDTFESIYRYVIDPEGRPSPADLLAAAG